MRDSDPTLRELEAIVRRFCEARDWGRFHTPKDLAIGVSTEAAELLAHFRFRSTDEISEMLRDQHNRASVGDELADVLYFLLRLAELCDLDLAAEFKRKMKINEAKYPAHVSKGTNKKYTEL